MAPRSEATGQVLRSQRITQKRTCIKPQRNPKDMTMSNSDNHPATTWTCSAWQQTYMEVLRALQRGEQSNAADAQLTFEPVTAAAPPSSAERIVAESSNDSALRIAPPNSAA